MSRLFLDTETRSTIPLKYGVRKYSRAVELLTIQWSIDGGTPYLWDAYSNPETPEELVNALNVATEVWAAGAEFDRTVLETLPWYNQLCRVPLERWRCLQALARLHGLPGGLDKLSKIFNLGIEGKKEGKELIKFFCVPRQGDKQYNRPEDHQAKWADFLLYAVWDVPSMYEVWRKIPKWNSVPKEWALYHADQRMNDRGVQFDIELAKAVIVATEKEKQRLKDKTFALTDGAVASATQRDKLLDYLLAELDIALPDLRADTIERRLADDNIPDVIKGLLRVRLMASKSSVTKYKRVVECEVNGRLHNLITFRGAQRTGRMSGRIFQPQNLVRKDPDLTQADIEVFVAAFKSGDIELIVDNVNHAAAQCLRGLIIAKPGYKLVASDLANIEGRKLAWLAGEDWKLKAFAAFDRGEGHDMYRLSYAGAFNIDPEDVDDHMRQIGKVCLAGNTMVLCRRGWKRLDAITLKDEVWDGLEWIKHGGLACNGKKRVLQLYGVSLTPDHLVLAGKTWQRADNLARSEEKMSLALETALGMLPSPASSPGAMAECEQLLLSVAAAARSTRSTPITSSEGFQLGAICARIKQRVKNAIGNIYRLWRTMSIVAASSIAWPPLLVGATTPPTLGGATTAVEEYGFAHFGEKAAPRFWSTFKRCLGGMCRNLKWTALTTQKAIGRGTLRLSASERISETDARCNTSNKKTLVYDLLSCGPRKRFLIKSARGPLLVHNCELALGYYGGVGAFLSMAAVYSIDLDAMAAACWPTLPEKIQREGPSRYEKALKRKRVYDLAPKTFMVCDALVRMWREAHPATRDYWYKIEEAVRAAIATPERVFNVRNVAIDRKGAWLRIKLPSGRYLCYPSPQIAESDEYNNGTIRFLGVDPYTRQWAKIKTYSGKVVENIDQASSADQMTDGMVDAEAEGYPPVLTVHDELICEVPDTAEHTAVELSAILARTRGWNDGLPLTAKGHEMYRYGK